MAVGVNAGTAYIDVKANLSNFAKGLERRVRSSLAPVAKAAGVALGAAGTAALAGLGAVIKTGISEFGDYQKGLAQTQAVIKSTGGIAGVTAQHVEDMASSLQSLTGQTDDAIVSTQDLLLTFTNIRNVAGKNNDIFDQSTKIVLDMSQALGQDTKSSAIQLGKALQDPIKGITALRRVGVSFTDQQREQIKALVESGNVMGAQKIILAELNREFGGSAAAFGKTLPGQIEILKRSFEDLSQSALQEALPALTGIFDVVKEVLPDVLKSLGPAISGVFSAIAPLLKAILPLLGDLARVLGPVLAKIVKALAPFLDKLAPIFGDLAEAVGELLIALVPLLPPLGELIVAIAPLLPLLVKLTTFLVKLAVKALVPLVKVIAAVTKWVVGLATSFKSTGKAVAGFIDPIVDAFKLLGRIFAEAWDAISSAFEPAVRFFEALWDAIVEVFETSIDVIRGIFKTIAKTLAEPFKTVFNIIKGVFTFYFNVYKKIVTTAFDAIKAVTKTVWNGIVTVFRTIFGMLKSVFSSGVGVLKIVFGSLGTAAVKMRDVVVGAVRFLLDKFLAAVGFIVSGAAKAFGWVPKIGPKLRDAAAEFKSFRDRVNNYLAGIKDQTVNVKILLSTGALAGALVGAGGKLPANASGGPVAAGSWSWVGEKGPELVHFKSSGQVFSHEDSMRMASGDTYNIVVNNPVGKSAPESFLYARKRVQVLVGK